jgi:hypothetical protein
MVPFFICRIIIKAIEIESLTALVSFKLHEEKYKILLLKNPKKSISHEGSGMKQTDYYISRFSFSMMKILTENYNIENYKLIRLYLFLRTLEEGKIISYKASTFHG